MSRIRVRAGRLTGTAGAVGIAVATLAAAGAAAPPVPPVAKVEPHRFEEHGHVRIDNYYWLKERENPEVLAYLQAENRYTDAVLAPLQDLRQTLFREITGRIAPDDASAPVTARGYVYRTRYTKEGEYPIYCRHRGSLDAPEEVMLDGNEVARGHDYFAVRGVSVSSGNDILAFAVDTVGRRFYTIRFRNLTTGAFLPDSISDVTSNLVWAEDNRTLFYTRQDPETLRWARIYRHTLGTDPAEDVLVYEEPDETYDAYVEKTKSRKYILVTSEQTLATEVRYLDATHPDGELRVFEPRARDHEYSVDHLDGAFYIRTNWKARNFRLMKTAEGHTGKEHWEEVVPGRQDVFLEGYELFRDYLVVQERRDGLNRIRYRPAAGGDWRSLDFEEPAYVAAIDRNPEADTRLLRYSYSSMTTPESYYDLDMDAGTKTLVKRDPVLGGYDPAGYVTERLVAPARDGVGVPISLVYRKGIRREGGNPLLLYGYGSYGLNEDADFRSSRISLLDRGFVYAIAHVRGGQEMGRQWYEDGKLLHKKNTFTDFIDCAQFLVDRGYADPQRLFASGGSAGGLLMGAVVNMRPDLWKGVVADVPFVDVMTTMLDPSIPLTTAEYDEWGNPNDPVYYDYMLSYSPVDNVQAKAYPAMLVTTGLHDSQVQYWEPAKWVAKLRALKTDSNPLLLEVNMEAGHSGRSGRYTRYRETALEYAFFLDRAGIRK